MELAEVKNLGKRITLFIDPTSPFIPEYASSVGRWWKTSNIWERHSDCFIVLQCLWNLHLYWHWLTWWKEQGEHWSLTYILSNFIPYIVIFCVYTLVHASSFLSEALSPASNPYWYNLLLTRTRCNRLRCMQYWDRIPIPQILTTKTPIHNLFPQRKKTCFILYIGVSSVAPSPNIDASS